MTVVCGAEVTAMIGRWVAREQPRQVLRPEPESGCSLGHARIDGSYLFGLAGPKGPSVRCRDGAGLAVYEPTSATIALAGRAHEDRVSRRPAVVFQLCMQLIVVLGAERQVGSRQRSHRRSVFLHVPQAVAKRV